MLFIHALDGYKTDVVPQEQNEKVFHHATITALEKYSSTSSRTGLQLFKLLKCHALLLKGVISGDLRVALPCIKYCLPRSFIDITIY